MPFAAPVKATPAARIFNTCAPSRRDKLNKQLLDLAEGPFNGFGYRHEDWLAFEKLLKAGADMNARNKNGDTVLNLACAKGHREAALKLLELGCDAHTPNNAGMTPFLSAVHAGEPVLVRAFLVKGADLQSRDAQGKNAVDILMGYMPPGVEASPQNQAQRREILELLLGAGLHLSNYLENRIYRVMDYMLPVVPALQAVHALSKAAANGDHMTAQDLFFKGLHPDAPVAYGDHAPLSVAAHRGDLALLEAAFAAGADINLASGGGKTTALHRAVLSGQKESIAMLLAAGADPHIPFGPYECNPLIMIAKDSRNPDLLAFVTGALSHLGPAPEVSFKATVARKIPAARKTARATVKISIQFNI